MRSQKLHRPLQAVVPRACNRACGAEGRDSIRRTKLDPSATPQPLLTRKQPTAKPTHRTAWHVHRERTGRCDQLARSGRVAEWRPTARRPLSIIRSDPGPADPHWSPSTHSQHVTSARWVRQRPLGPIQSQSRRSNKQRALRRVHKQATSNRRMSSIAELLPAAERAREPSSVAAVLKCASTGRGPVSTRQCRSRA